MSAAPQKCHTVTVHAFRGARGRLGRELRTKLYDASHRGGNEPSRLDCLLYAGHTGVSIDPHQVIYGFTPRDATIPLSQMLQRLLNGDAFDGVVEDDTHVFDAATANELKVQTFNVIFPDMAFSEFEQRLNRELTKSQFKYRFPNGDGDCNCTTWLERLALPLLSGSMEEFAGLPGFSHYPSRRFGTCV